MTTQLQTLPLTSSSSCPSLQISDEIYKIDKRYFDNSKLLFYASFTIYSTLGLKFLTKISNPALIRLCRLIGRGQARQLHHARWLAEVHHMAYYSALIGWLFKPADGPV